MEGCASVIHINLEPQILGGFGKNQNFAKAKVTQLECSVLPKHTERFSPLVNVKSCRIAGGQVAHYPHHQQQG